MVSCAQYLTVVGCYYATRVHSHNARPILDVSYVCVCHSGRGACVPVLRRRVCAWCSLTGRCACSCRAHSIKITWLDSLRAPLCTRARTRPKSSNIEKCSRAHCAPGITSTGSPAFVERARLGWPLFVTAICHRALSLSPVQTDCRLSAFFPHDSHTTERVREERKAPRARQAPFTLFPGL